MPFSKSKNKRALSSLHQGKTFHICAQKASGCLINRCPWRANIAKLKRSNSLNLLDLPILPMLREWNYILPGLIYRPAVKPILALRMKARVYEVKHSERPIEKKEHPRKLYL